MNTEHARTFLAVADTGSFVAAAQRLHVTQSTVSARVRALEENLGRQLFIRNKAGAQLTSSGSRFLKHAGLMVRTLEHARHDIGLPGRFRASVVIGARIGLWEDLLINWLSQRQKENSDVSFRAEIGFEPEIMQGLIEGRIDVGFLYTPQRRPNLDLLPFVRERLVMVSSSPQPTSTAANYVHVDWGPEFQDQFAAAFPVSPAPAVTFNIGTLGLQFLRLNGGCGYFPYRLVKTALESKQFFLVPDVPAFELPAWIVIRQDRDKTLVDPMLDVLPKNG
ncbi:MAG: LysR family transcriptional regulator [Nitratireductor sp.]|nr:LysR family transcriptional regulator [Nitratireductor sp.]